jgi:ribonuclease P protein component
LTLGRGQRLIRPGDFARLRADGQRLAQGCLVANWVALQPPQRSRLGVVTSKKVGGAVVRNRARRLLRDVFRHHQHELSQPVDLVLVARPSIAALRRPQVERDYLAALRRARLLRETPGASAA